MAKFFVFSITTIFLATFSGTFARADDKPDLSKCFIGKIVHADDFDQVNLYRGGDTSVAVRVNAFTQLYWGDLLEVTSDQTIVIRDHPGKSRPLDRSKGLIRIGEGATCEVRPSMRDLAQTLGAGLTSFIGGPLPAEPRMTMTMKGDDGTVPASLTVNLDGPQKIISGQPDLTVWWANRPAIVRLSAPDGVELEARPRMRNFATMAWQDLTDEPIGTWVLSILGPKEILDITLEVVPAADLPRPPDVTSLETLNAEERVILASWLSTNGPPEWRLQGWSMLADEAKTSYAAWRLWRGMIAQKVTR